jgi:hypothetical protein
MSEKNWKASWLRTAQDLLFCANVAIAAVFTILIYVVKSGVSGESGYSSSHSDLVYWFRRAAIRITDLLHLPTVNSVATDAAARLRPTQWGHFGQELIILISVLATAFILFPVLRLLANRISGPIALVAVSAYYLGASEWLSPYLAPRLLLIIPASALLLSAWKGGPRRPNRWPIPCALLSLVVIGALWSQPFARSIHPKDLDSAEIKLTGGPCRGPCRSNLITIHGNGALVYVEYLPIRHSENFDTNVKTGSITREQLRSILQRLDSVRFLDLEDRAFAWCYDTGSIGISLWVDGHTKRVSSDAWCVGAKSGAQDRFVRAALEISKIALGALPPETSRP